MKPYQEKKYLLSAFAIAVVVHLIGFVWYQYPWNNDINNLKNDSLSGVTPEILVEINLDNTEPQVIQTAPMDQSPMDSAEKNFATANTAEKRNLDLIVETGTESKKKQPENKLDSAATEQDRIHEGDELDGIALTGLAIRVLDKDVLPMMIQAGLVYLVARIETKRGSSNYLFDGYIGRNPSRITAYKDRGTVVKRYMQLKSTMGISLGHLDLLVEKKIVGQIVSKDYLMVMSDTLNATLINHQQSLMLTGSWGPPAGSKIINTVIQCDFSSSDQEVRAVFSKIKSGSDSFPLNYEVKL